MSWTHTNKINVNLGNVWPWLYHPYSQFVLPIKFPQNRLDKYEDLEPTMPQNQLCTKD
jgi:hypothetical protein